jgi:glycolate oxidase FAD binding subunit
VKAATLPDLIKPRDLADVEAAVQWALAQQKTLEIVGQGSKRALGRPAQTDATLDLSAIAGVTLYEPEELVLSAKAGTPLAEIERLVAAHNQELAFEPMDYGPVLGVGLGQGTIGGALATNLSGPRRPKAGAARDHFLGVTAVSGHGSVFKSGGRVVKNVTGYDLCKLLAGSWGTLAVMVDVTLKTLPRAETEATLAVLGLDDAAAVEAMGAALGSSCDISGAAHLPATVAARTWPQAGLSQAVTAMRLEGIEASVTHRRRALEDLMRPRGAIAVLAPDQSRIFWRAIRDATMFAADGPAAEASLWRISTAPVQGAELARLLATAGDVELAYDWAGGLIWAAIASTSDAGSARVRDALAVCGGHAMLVRAPAATRALVSVFAPQEQPLAALTARVKAGFDPQGVLNPGRMWAGV